MNLVLHLLVSRVRGLDLKSSALYSMLPFIAMVCGATQGGWVADWITRHYGPRLGRCGLAIFGLMLAAVFPALAKQVENARLASIVLAGGAGAIYVAQSAYWSVTADIVGKSVRTVSGLMNMGGQIGGAVTVSLTPWPDDIEMLDKPQIEQALRELVKRYARGNVRAHLFNVNDHHYFDDPARVNT